MPHHVTQRGNRLQQTFYKEDEIELFRKHERNGRPVGDETFFDMLETLLERTLRPQKPGPKKKDA